MEVRIEKDGREVAVVDRPVRTVEGRRVVTYKGKQYPVNAGAIEIGDGPKAGKASSKHADTSSTLQARLVAKVVRVKERFAAARAAKARPAEADGLKGLVVPVTPGPAPVRKAGEPVTLTDEQKAVANASADARILVEAGPGTGKTETVAHRLVSLLRQGLLPSEILVLSFSRNAVKTLSSRIERMQGEEVRHVEDLRYLSVRTFDSWTFRMLRQLGFQPADLLRREYEANIHELVQQLKGPKGTVLREQLSGIRHVIVDEFQDLSGVRGGLVLELLQTLAPPRQQGAGFTVLGDPAQAIYSFSLQNAPEAYRALTSGALINELGKKYGKEAIALSLGTNFRAGGELGALIAELRRQLLHKASARSKLETIVRVTGQIRELEGELKPEMLLGPDVGSAAILTSTNGEAIRVAQKMMGSESGSSQPASVRLHVRGQPRVVPAWLGATLGRFKDSSLTRTHFKRIHDHLYSGAGQYRARALEVPAWDVAWGRLARATGVSADSTSIDLGLLRSRLDWPDLLPDEESVQHAAIHVMTIHQSKGMEFDSVAIMTDQLGSRELETEAQELEAANVIFVGMTRAARQLLRVGGGQMYGPLVHGSFADDRRRWYCWHHGWVNMEAGLIGDIDPVGFIDRRVFGEPGAMVSEQTVTESQEFLATHSDTLRGRKVMLCRWPMPGVADRFVYRMHLQEENVAGRVLGIMTDHLTLDILHLVWSRGYSLPSRIFNLRISDVVTLGVQRELPVSAAQPWASSGLWLGVNLCGTADFKTFKR